MGINITDKISEFAFEREGRVRKTIPAQQLRDEKCRYSFIDEGKNPEQFFGRVDSVWSNQNGKTDVHLKTADGKERELLARLYIIEEQGKPTDRIGAYLETVSRIE